jgi:hypothetical protein
MGASIDVYDPSARWIRSEQDARRVSPNPRPVSASLLATRADGRRYSIGVICRRFGPFDPGPPWSSATYNRAERVPPSAKFLRTRVNACVAPVLTDPMDRAATVSVTRCTFSRASVVRDTRSDRQALNVEFDTKDD